MAANDNKKPDPQTGPINGVAHAFCETGTEGIIWSVQDEKYISADGKQWSYDGLNCLDDGDFLRIFNDAARKEVIWEGEIKLKYPPKTDFNRGVQDGVDEAAWTKMFFDEKPATLLRKQAYLKMKADARAKAAMDADITRACHEGVAVKPMKRIWFKKPEKSKRRPKPKPGRRP